METVMRLIMVNSEMLVLLILHVRRGFLLPDISFSFWSDSSSSVWHSVQLSSFASQSSW